MAAARLLRDRCVCFVGIGLPSAACNLARLTHAPDIVLIYESGTIGTRPEVLPLSIGDGELAETAACVVPLPEIFSYYLQAGRVDVGFLGAAQIDRYGNLNSTVIGPYDAPSTRLPGAGGAPEIALHAQQVFVMLKATPRSFVERLDFRTSAGYLDGHGAARAQRRHRRRPARGDHRLRHAGTAPATARSCSWWRCSPTPASTRRAPRSAGRCASPTASTPSRRRARTNSTRCAHCNARTREAHARPVHLPALSTARHSP